MVKILSSLERGPGKKKKKNPRTHKKIAVKDSRTSRYTPDDGG